MVPFPPVVPPPVSPPGFSAKRGGTTGGGQGMFCYAACFLCLAAMSTMDMVYAPMTMATSHKMKPGPPETRYTTSLTPAAGVKVK